MRVLMLHQAIGQQASLDEQDVLQQRDAVHGALQQLGHEVQCIPVTLALDELQQLLEASRPDLVFNLVESLEGCDRLIGLVPLLLDALEIPYTGVPANAILASSDKLLAKARLAKAGLPTLPWIAPGLGLQHVQRRFPLWPSQWILKAVFEHASFGMTDEAVVWCDSPEEAVSKTLQWQDRLGRPCFAEPFIGGREFNLSLLAKQDGPEVLPPAEIDFSRFPEDKPRIVGFAAKWREGTDEFASTPRRFDFLPGDKPLLQHLGELAVACWQEFQMAGYCRVDFRVDDSGSPWILEINANPCLALDAGFAAAGLRAGYPFSVMIGRIVDDTIRSSAAGRLFVSPSYP